MPLFTDELDELDVIELDEVRIVNLWWRALSIPSATRTTWLDIFTHSKFFILNLLIVFFPKQSCTQPPFFYHTPNLSIMQTAWWFLHVKVSHYVYWTAFEVTCFLSLDNQQHGLNFQKHPPPVIRSISIPVVMYYTTVPIIEYSGVSHCN